MDYGGGDHQTADQGCVWLFGCRSRGLGLRPRLYACFVTHSADAVAVSSLWRYISIMSFTLLRHSIPATSPSPPFDNI